MWLFVPQYQQPNGYRESEYLTWVSLHIEDEIIDVLLWW